MTKIDLSRAERRKSSYSGQSGNCAEVARNLPAPSSHPRLQVPRRPHAAGLPRDLASVPPDPPRLGLAR
jgi:Domain of unknown function (DUF397)